MYSNLIFVKFIVLLFIVCLSVPNLSLNSSRYIPATLILKFTSRLLVFQEVFKFFFTNNLIQYRGIFNCRKCVITKSSNLFSNKLLRKLRKFTFQSLLSLLLINSMFLSLLFFKVTMKNLKTKIQFLLHRILHSVTIILLIQHIWLNWLMIKIIGVLNLILSLTKSTIKDVQFVTGI